MPLAKILVVEDDSIIAEDIRLILLRLGYAISGITNNGPDAIQLSLSEKPDAIIMDITLRGEMDGIETSQKINEVFSVPIIYLTARQDKATIEKSKLTNPYGYMLKPLNERDLNSCLRMALYRFDTEKKLKESEERYFRLTENARDMIFRRSIVNGIYEYVNKASLSITGYSPNEFYSDPMLVEKIIHPDWKNYFRVLWENLKEGEVPDIYEFQIINKSGEARWLNQRNVMIKNTDGVPVALEGIVTDVTDRKKTEALIRKHSEEYRMILDSMPAMVLVKDFNNKLIRVNKQAAIKQGVKAEEMEGKYWEEFYTDETGESLKTEREIMVSGTPKLDSIESYKNGISDTKWAKVDRFPFRNEKGEITGVIVFSQDITERKQFEIKLGESEARYRNLTDKAPICLTRLLVKERIYEFANAEFVRQSGYTLEEFNNLTDEELNNLIYEDDRDRVLSEYSKWAKDGCPGVKHMTYRFTNKNGNMLWLDTYHYAEFNTEEKIYAINQIYIDVTEQKKSEYALRLSEEKFRAVADTTHAVIFIYQDDKFVYGNSYAEVLSGYSLEELYQMNFWDLVHPDYREEAKARGQARQKGENLPSRYEMKMVCKSGEEKWIDFSASLFEYEGRVAVLGTAIDITERKKINEAIKASEEKYRNLSQNAPVAVTRLSLDKNKYEFVNDEFVRQSGYSKEEINSLPDNVLANIIHIDDRSRILFEYNHWFNSGCKGVKFMEYKVINRNNQLLWLNTYLYAEFDSAGNPATINQICIDVTDRKEAAELVKLSEEKFRAVAESMPAQIVIFQGEKFVYANPYTEKLTGYTVMETLGMNFWDLVHPDSMDIVKATGMARQKGKLVPESYEIKILTKSNEEKWLFYSAKVINYNGNPAILGTAIDITQLKNAEESLKSSLIEKEILLKEIHHRVKNNLQIVSSLLKLQSTYIKDITSLNLFKESQNRVQSMALIHQKLYQARDLTNINFSEYAGSLISYLMQTFGITPDLMEVSINPEKIFMSIDNAIPAGLIINELVTNSIKHGFPSGSPGKIDICTSYDETTENYTLTVRDNGVGISDEIDIHKSPSFGLKLVTTLTEQMKGNISVIRENGTMFIVTMKNAHYKERA